MANHPYPPQGYPQQPQQNFPQAPQIGWPQQPQQTMAYPPPGYPQQTIPMPPYLPQGYPQQQYQPAYQQQQQVAPPSGGFFIPNEEVVRQAYLDAEEAKKRTNAARSGGSGKLKFFAIAGPNGQAWKTAYVSYVGAKAAYILPSWREGVMNFVERITHFWKSHQFPQGKSINSAGQESLIAQAYELALEQGTKQPWCRPAKKYVFQCFPYEYDISTGAICGIEPAQCQGEDGQLRPLLLEVGYEVWQKIMEISNTRGFTKTFHPDFGRPIVVKKTKTGPQQIDVEYSVIDLDQQPLADVYRQGLGNLYALDELFAPATEDEQIAAIKDAGLPMPHGAGAQGQAQTGYAYAQSGPQAPMQQQSYQQAPMPPAPSPYAQPQYAPPQQQQNWPPQGVPAAPMGQMPYAPPQAPKPLPPPPQGQYVPNAPMLPPMPQQQVQGPPPMQRMPVPQGPAPSKPLTPEDIQQQLQGDMDVPF